MQNILLLPFKNLSGVKEDNYLCNSVPIEITHLLSKYKLVRIILNQSVAPLDNKGNNQETGYIDFVLKGSFIRVEERIRFNIQLINSKNDFCLLSVKLEESSSNIFELIDKIALKIIEYLKPEITKTTSRPKIGALAYEHYLKGLQHWNLWNPTNIKKAINHFEKVIKLQPEFALGYTRLSYCYSLLAVIETEDNLKYKKNTRKLALKAITLDDSNAESHLSLFLIKLLNDIDILGAYYSIEKAFSINNHLPETHYYYGYYLLVIGEYKKAIEAIKYALESNPENVQINSTYGFALSLDGKYSLAEEQLKKTLALHPDSIPTYDALIWNYLLGGELQKAQKLVEQNEMEIFLSPATQIVLYHNLGLTSEMEKWKRKMDDRVKEDSNFVFSPEASIVYYTLGDIKKGFKHFESFYNRKTGFIRALTHPAWKVLRESDKFYIYKKRLKLLHPPILPLKLSAIDDDIIVLNSTTKETLSIASRNLLYIESEGIYSKVVYKDDFNELSEKILRVSLTKIINESLYPNLYRCHNSFIINTKTSYSIMGNRKNLKLYLGGFSFKIPVSRTKTSEIYNHLSLLD